MGIAIIIIDYVGIPSNKGLSELLLFVILDALHVKLLLGKTVFYLRSKQHHTQAHGFNSCQWHQSLHICEQLSISNTLVSS